MLFRSLAKCPDDAALRSVQACGATAMPQVTPALQALHDWAAAQGRLPLAHQCARLAACNLAGLEALLPGPTGERNIYRVQARRQVLCRVGSQASAESDLWVQMAAVLAVGGQAVLSAANAALCARLPGAVQAQLVFSDTLQAEAALISAPADEVLDLAAQLATQDGPIVTLTALQPGQTEVPLARLVSERSISTNTAAAGGNASLMTLAA